MSNYKLTSIDISILLGDKVKTLRYLISSSKFDINEVRSLLNEIEMLRSDNDNIDVSFNSDDIPF